MLAFYESKFILDLFIFLGVPREISKTLGHQR
jgi:hypothetical protein